MDRARERTFCEVTKTLYVATKAHYREKLSRRAAREGIGLRWPDLRGTVVAAAEGPGSGLQNTEYTINI